jgi:hypothetical protein
VEAVLDVFATELDRTLALLGLTSFDDVDASVLDAPPTVPTPRTDGSAGA